MAELLDYRAPSGIIKIPIKQQGIAKILEVEDNGRATILISLSKFSNQPTIIALISVYPLANSPVIVKYLEGIKYTNNNYEPKIYYNITTSGYIEIYVTTPAYESCGYRVISSYGADFTVSQTSLPEGAIQI